MNDILWMQIPYSYTDIDEYFPNDIINEWFARRFLLDDDRIQITKWTVFQDDIYLLIINEWVKISNDVGWIKSLHGIDLLECFKSHFLRNFCHIDDFNDVVLVFK